MSAMSLHLAATTFDLCSAAKALEAGVSVDAKDLNGATALMHAADCGDVLMVEWLVHKKANANAQTVLGTTAMMLAAQNGEISVVHALQSADLELKDAEDRRALYFAAGHGHSLVVKHLVGLNASLNAKEMYGWTALMIACHEGRFLAAKRLIAAGADLEERSTDGGRALMFAATRGRLKVVKLLVSARAQVDALDTQQKTALMLAVKEDHVKTVKWLVRHGKANVHLQGVFGTALDIASRRGKAKKIEGAKSVAIVQWFESVQCGADNCRDAAFKKCGGCQQKKYCCKECQVRDWEKHACKGPK